MKATYTDSQMGWMLCRGYAWVDGDLSDHDWRQPVYTAHGEYYWMPPHIDSEGVSVLGMYVRHDWQGE